MGFALTRIFPYNDRFLNEKMQVRETRIFVYLTQWKLPQDNKKECTFSNVNTTFPKMNTS